MSLIISIGIRKNVSSSPQIHNSKSAVNVLGLILNLYFEGARRLVEQKRTWTIFCPTLIFALPEGYQFCDPAILSKTALFISSFISSIPLCNVPITGLASFLARSGLLGCWDAYLSNNYRILLALCTYIASPKTTTLCSSLDMTVSTYDFTLGNFLQDRVPAVP